MKKKVKFPTFIWRLRQSKWSSKQRFVCLFASVEKDPHDTSQKAKESQDTSHKILELQKKLDSVRSQVKTIYRQMPPEILI